VISLALLWMACGEPHLADPLAPPMASVERGVEARRVGAGEPVVLEERLEWAAGWTAPEVPIAVDGLSVELLEDREEGDGARRWRVRRFALSGQNGSYFLPAASLRFQGPEGAYRDVPAAAVDFDIGVDGPSSDLAGLLSPPAEDPVRWKIWVLIGLGLIAKAIFSWWVWKRWKRWRARPSPPVPLPAPDVEALAAWEELQADPTLNDHARALGLSRIFRRYLERSLEGVLASTWTQREILQALKGKELDQALLARSKKVLSATDALKFARRGGGQAFFDELDKDLRRVIEQTRTQLEERPGA